MDQTSMLFSEAQRHHESGELTRAEPLYRQVLRVDPRHADALFHLGTLELQQARRAAGMAPSQMASVSAASDADPAQSLRSRLVAGIDLLRQAAALRPDMAEIHNNLGLAYKALGEWNSAAQAFEQAIAVDSQSAGAYFNMADLAESLGQNDAAVACYRQAISLNPREPQHFARLGDLLFKHGNWAGAEHCFATALALNEPAGPADVVLSLQSKLGMALIRQEKLDEAVRIFQRMLEREPDFAEIHNNLAYVYERQGRFDEALDAARRAIHFKPGYAEGHNNLGVALRALHRLGESRLAFQRAAELKPDFALAHFNFGTICLMAGDYCQGWPSYEWRSLTLKHPPRVFAVPRWDGRSLPGGTLLVHTEQGYGDTIQFARFVQQARDRSQARVILEGPAALTGLLRQVVGVDEYRVAGSALPALDAEVPLPSLPGVLGVELSNLPAQVPYLTVPAGLRSEWRERIAALSVTAAAANAGPCADSAATSLKIGIVWQGNPLQPQDIVRSCPFAHFGRLAEFDNISWFSLQKDPISKMDVPGRPVINEPGRLHPVELGPHLRDFSDTAAILCELDLLISVDTSVAHLAGALGRPVWTILCHTPDWRWHLDRADSPWYPTMRLFRQPAWGDWSAVFEQVAQELQKLVAR